MESCQSRPGTKSTPFKLSVFFRNYQLLFLCPSCLLGWQSTFDWKYLLWNYYKNYLFLFWKWHWNSQECLKKKGYKFWNANVHKIKMVAIKFLDCCKLKNVCLMSSGKESNPFLADLTYVTPDKNIMFDSHLSEFGLSACPVNLGRRFDFPKYNASCLSELNSIYHSSAHLPSWSRARL